MVLTVGESILQETDPAKQKRIASAAMKQISLDPTWMHKQHDVMEAGLYAKFDPHQNPVNAVALRNTTLQLVECNAYDTHWAIGLSLHGKEKLNRAK